MSVCVFFSFNLNQMQSFDVCLNCNNVLLSRSVNIGPSHFIGKNFYTFSLQVLDSFANSALLNTFKTL